MSLLLLVDEAYLCQVEAVSPPMMVASPLPVVMAPSPPSEGINPAVSEKTLIASHGVAVIQDKADSPQEPSPSPPFASRPITRLKLQQALKVR